MAAKTNNTLRTATLITLCAAAAAMTGCRTPAKVARTNDALRLERESLKERVATLESVNAELRSKLLEAQDAARASADVESFGVLPGDVLDAMPRIAGVSIVRTSGIEVTESGEAVARVFVRPLDGRDRFIQAVAVMEVQLIGLHAASQSGDARPSGSASLAEQLVRPSELRNAYTEGLLGPSYRLVLPLDPATLADENSVAVRVTLYDLITGASFEAERLLRVPADAAAQISSVNPR